MSIGDLIAGTTTFVVGVEDDAETGDLRMYVGHSANGVYALVRDGAAKEALRQAWRGGRPVTVPIPPAEVLFTTDERP